MNFKVIVSSAFKVIVSSSKAVKYIVDKIFLRAENVFMVR